MCQMPWLGINAWGQSLKALDEDITNPQELGDYNGENDLTDCTKLFKTHSRSCHVFHICIDLFISSGLCWQPPKFYLSLVIFQLIHTPPKHDGGYVRGFGRCWDGYCSPVFPAAHTIQLILPSITPSIRLINTYLGPVGDKNEANVSIAFNGTYGMKWE